MLTLLILVDVSDISIFFCSGRGRGSPRRQEGRGDRFFIENPRRGGVPGGGGAKGPGGCLRRIGEILGGGG